MSLLHAFARLRLHALAARGDEDKGDGCDARTISSFKDASAYLKRPEVAAPACAFFRALLQRCGVRVEEEQGDRRMEPRALVLAYAFAQFDRASEHAWLADAVRACATELVAVVQTVLEQCGGETLDSLPAETARRFVAAAVSHVRTLRAMQEHERSIMCTKLEAALFCLYNRRAEPPLSPSEAASPVSLARRDAFDSYIRRVRAVYQGINPDGLAHFDRRWLRVEEERS
jgi:hypothetical protein